MIDEQQRGQGEIASDCGSARTGRAGDGLQSSGETGETAAFIPPHPPRPAGPVAVWRGFVGERARTAVYGWSERAFELPYIRRRVLGYNIHIPLDPALVEQVLLDNAANYEKPDPVKRLLERTIGRGLLSSDGELWRAQRRIVAASFTPPAVDSLVPLFARAAEAAAERWREGRIDMAAEATTTTMAIIADALFAGDRRLASRTAMDHIAAALEGVAEARLQVMLGIPLIPWSLRGWRARRGQVYLRRTLTQVVRERLGGGGEDFLSKLVRALQERFPAAEAEALAVDNAATFYLAGHETTANALTWALFLLAEQPELQDQAAAEAQAALASGSDGLIERLPLLRRILDETLRLYPSAPRFDRQAVASDRLGAEAVEAGDIVSIWPWLLHRHRALWDRPDTFDADRFRPDAPARHRFQYIPFGAGPRVCVGARFATVEALTILAYWLARWRFAPEPDREVLVSGLVTLRPRGGLPLRLERRS